jgi:hypothetical protein
MKILLLNQSFHPDATATAQQLSDLALFLRKKGHEVSVVCERRAYEERKTIFPKEETWQGIRIERVGSTGFGKSRFRYRIIDGFTFFVSLVWKLLWFPSQDLVISFTSPPLIGFFGVLFCALKGGRSVQWLMDINPEAAFQVGYLNRHTWLGRFLNGVYVFTIKKASEVIVLDRWMKKIVVSQGAEADSVVVVPPWSVCKKESEGLLAEVQAFRRQHGLENKFVVLYSGNHSVVHPLETLLETARLMREDTKVVFLFIGFGLRVPEVKKFKEEKQLENIIQLPFQPRHKVKASFGSADLHAVVMGPKMSGLVHVSKIYTVLNSGKPFVFIGPEKSHVNDVIRFCPTGKSLCHNEPQKLIAAIRETKSLAQPEKERLSEISIDFVKGFDPETTMERFYKEIVLKEKPTVEAGVLVTLTD